MTLRQLRQMASDLGVTLQPQEQKIWFQRLPSGRSGAVATSPSRLNHTPAQSQSDTRVVFLHRDPQWAYVFWEISDSDRRRAQSEGAAHLSLRLADVTGLQNGSAHPHTLQEVPVDSHSTEWYLPVPLCDRDYRVELGFRSGSNWISLAFLGGPRSCLHPATILISRSFSLEAAAPAPAPVAPPAEPSDSGLHERLYQSATTHSAAAGLVPKCRMQDSMAETSAV